MLIMYSDSSPVSEAASLKRATPDTDSDDSRPRKRSRSASSAGDHRTQSEMAYIPCCHNAVDCNTYPPRTDDHALDELIINDDTYECALSLGEIGLADILTIVAELGEGFDPRCMSIKKARELVRSDIRLKKLLSECVKTGHYAPVRHYAPIHVQPTVKESLASEKAKWQPCLTHLAHSDCLGHDTHGDLHSDIVSLLIPENISEEALEMEGYAEKTFVRGEQKVLFDGPGTRKTQILVAGMRKYAAFYLVPHRKHESSPGSGSLMCALQRIFTERNRRARDPDYNIDYSKPELIRVINRLLDLAMLAHAVAFDWFLECSEGVPIPDVLRRWTRLQLFPSTAAMCEDGDIFVSILNRIISWTDDPAISSEFLALRQRRESHFGRSEAFIILDDAHLAEDVAAAANFLPSELSKHGESSMLSLIASSWQKPGRFLDVNVIMSGIKIPMYLDTDIPQSAVAKPGSIRWRISCAAGGFDSKRSQSAYITVAFRPIRRTL